MMQRPVIGVVACTRMVGVEPGQAVMSRYLDAALRYADVAALLVPTLPDLIEARELAPRLDALLLTGSPSNIEPHRYGLADAGEGPFDPGRDEMVTRMIDAMLQRKRPVFGICRGLQEINVAFGGTLRRDASTMDAALAHHAPDDANLTSMFAHGHEVALVEDGLLERLYGRPTLSVNSVHYQAIDRLGGDLSAEAIAPDGLVEAVSTQVDGAPVVAVQWHPEWRAALNPDSQSFFRMFGRAARGQPLLEPSEHHAS